MLGNDLFLVLFCNLEFYKLLIYTKLSLQKTHKSQVNIVCDLTPFHLFYWTFCKSFVKRIYLLYITRDNIGIIFHEIYNSNNIFCG
jgi:hypothetical protein